MAKDWVRGQTPDYSKNAGLISKYLKSRFSDCAEKDFAIKV
jgi:hypothetical protein